MTTTGQEVWAETNGEVDGFICAVGTGGTLAGISRALKKHNDKVNIGISDPTGSALYNYFTTGELIAEGGSISEGIGTSRITENFAGTVVDMPYQIPDSESIPLVFDLIKDEGICCGGSTGVNVAGAVRMAKELGPGHVIVTILCDSGLRYRERLFNRKFLADKGLELPAWLNL